MRKLVFLKLGGSLITDKTQRHTARLERLDALAHEIQSALSDLPDVRLILGHGSGSFGHYAAQEYLAPRAPPLVGGSEPHEGAFWRGFSEVWYRASELNRYVMDALHRAGLPSISLPPSAMVKASNGVIKSWDLAPLRAAIESGLVPVTYGDIVFDAVTRASVLSTEKLMIYLARHLEPQRILLAGLEAAVWADFPVRQVALEKITPPMYAAISGKVGGSHGTDVTGGMKAKVEEMLGLVQHLPALRVQIFSGEEPGNVKKALAEVPLGTLLASD